MCHYTIIRCCDCGRNLDDITLRTCEQKDKGFCFKGKTNDGIVDTDGTHEIICPTGRPCPFIAFFDIDNNFRQVSRLHDIQELLAVCSTCSPRGQVSQRATDLGGFLFHLEFNTINFLSNPRRICLGRHVVDYCRYKTCKNTNCGDCERTGSCGHHGPLEDFKDYDENQDSMHPWLVQYSRFLDEADQQPRLIRCKTMHFATPLQEPQPVTPPGPCSDTTTNKAISEYAQDPAATAYPTPPASSPKSGPTPQLSATPPVPAAGSPKQVVFHSIVPESDNSDLLRSAESSSEILPSESSRLVAESSTFSQRFGTIPNQEQDLLGTGGVFGGTDVPTLSTADDLGDADWSGLFMGPLPLQETGGFETELAPAADQKRKRAGDVWTSIPRFGSKFAVPGNKPAMHHPFTISGALT